MAFLDDFKEKVAKSPSPVTIGLMVLCAVGTFIGFMTHYGDSFMLMTVLSREWATHPWTFVTYPFIDLLQGGLSVVFFLFLLSWLYMVGAPTEKELGWLKYLLLWLAISVVPGIFMLMGSALSHSEVGAFGPVVAVAYITFIWGLRNRNQPVSLFAVIPMNGFWLAMLAIVVVFVQCGASSLAVATFACIPMTIAYLFAMDKLPGVAYGGPARVNNYKPSKAAKAREQKYFDDIHKREQERQERERLRKLFEGSIDEEK